MSLLWRLSRRFPVLGRADFRWYWAGMFFYSFGMQARTVIVGWLIYYLTGSALSIGAYLGTWGLGALVFSFVGGTMSDRYGARRVVILFRAIASISLVVLFALYHSGHLAYWQILIISFVNGTVGSFEYPARSALLAAIVPTNELTSGFGLMYSAMNLASIIGPAAMGWVTEAVSPSTSLLITAGVALAASMSAIPIRVEQGGGTLPARRPSMLADVNEGLRYMMRERRLMLMEALLLVYVVVLMPYRDIMPAVAADVLGVGASGLGILVSSVSVGAFVGTLLLSMAGEVRPRGTVLIIAALIESIGVILYSRSAFLWLSAIILAVTGISRGFFIPINNALLQSYAAPNVRARVVGMNMTVWSFGPIGTLILGAAADQIGPGSAVLISSCIAATCFVLYMAFSRQLRTMQ